MRTAHDTHPNGPAWAEQQVKALTADALYYIKEGIDPEQALDIVRKETTLAPGYFNQVVDNVFSQRIPTP